jgi:large subunit ribosomal protein L34e
MGQLSKPEKKVSRPYGGSRCAKCVRNRCVLVFKITIWCIVVNRIVRAFLIEEQKIVKRLTKAKIPEVLRKKKIAEKQKAAQQKRERDAREVIYLLYM